MSTKLYPGIPFSPQAALTDNIGAADTIIEVSDASAFPPAPNLATIGTDEGGETVLYTAKTETALSGCRRGVEGVAKAWMAGEPIGRNFTAKDHADLIAAVSETGAAATAAGDAAQAAQEAASAAEGKATEAADAAAAKQDALLGQPGQVVGFGADGKPEAQDPPDTGVTSFKGRTGAVTPQAGDYTAQQVGALPITGGTLTGDVTIDPGRYNKSVLKLNNTNLELGILDEIVFNVADYEALDDNGSVIFGFAPSKWPVSESDGKVYFGPRDIVGSTTNIPIVRLHGLANPVESDEAVPYGFVREAMGKASLMHALTFGLPIKYYISNNYLGETLDPPKAYILKEGTVTAAVSGSGTVAFFTLNTGSSFPLVNGAQHLYLFPPIGLAFTNLNWCGNLYGQIGNINTKYQGFSVSNNGSILFSFPTATSGQIFSLHSGTDRPKFKVELL